MRKNNRSSLGNGITSDKQLDKWCHDNVPGYAGAIDRTEFSRLYKSMGAGQSAIINLDPHYSTGGTHWVAIRISSEAPVAYYKDSFGGPPPQDIVDSINDRGLIYGNRIYQDLDEDNCGRRAAHFLRDMARASALGREIEYFESTEK